MTSKVFLKKCPDYSAEKVTPAIKEIFIALDLASIIKPGKKVLLKPNLLMAFAPEKNVTTNPLIVKAVADEVALLGGEVVIGDSPGGVGSMYDWVVKTAQMDQLGYPVVSFDEKGMRKIDMPGATINPVLISNTVLNADIIINLAKMKTHEFTIMTCGIKNLFGCVPGLQKVNYHLEAPDPVDFASALVDIFQNVKPAVTIVDAVVSMEGSGPSNGKLKQTGFIFGSRDTVAVDAVAATMMNFSPMDIPMIRIAAERGLGKAYIEEISLEGDPMMVFKDFEHPHDNSPLKKFMPRKLLGLLKPVINMLSVRPRINNKKCVKCGMCVRSCPASAIDGSKFTIDEKKCIMCFCCRELCKYDAVERKESFLWRISKWKKKK
jgi:uncharacterized protein (DUF362 family)/Pyruvate/2-oxoacid:ferredoxin oxidoreductase delta subunit